jgi:hypothetical protein
MLNESTLNTYVGQPISQICPHGFDKPDDNHCAHFVSHALQLSLGYTCALAKGRAGAAAANLRVHELFPHCQNRREVLECPTVGEGLIFVSAPDNFKPDGINNVAKKHIGILLNGRVWHYSNTNHKVVVQSVGEFLFHYSTQTNALWFGSLPVQCRPTEFGTCS